MKGPGTTGAARTIYDWPGVCFGREKTIVDKSPGWLSISGRRVYEISDDIDGSGIGNWLVVDHELEDLLMAWNS